MYLEAITYRIVGAPEEVYLEVRHGHTWTIWRPTKEVMNKSGEWERDPMPSSRTEEFKQRTRWYSPSEALNAYATMATRKPT